MTGGDAALITDPLAIFGYLAGLMAFLFWLSGLKPLQRIFDITPPILYAYFLPTVSTALRIIPPASPAYVFMSRLLLPLSLFLLMVTVDLRAIMRLGRTALIMMLGGSLSVAIGAPITYAVFAKWLPPDAWKGLAALSGSWIGGSANMIAIGESIGAPASIMGPTIVVDTLVGYGWMAVLLAISSLQHKWDRRVGARMEALEETSSRLVALSAHQRPIDVRGVTIILGLGFAAAVAGIAAGGALPPVGDPVIISRTTWTILIVVTGGLLLSLTPIRDLEQMGASRLGYFALYLLLTAVGAQADLRALLAAPAFIAAGVFWIMLHIAILLLITRMLRAPFFFFATSSVANIGGVVSAPIVASVYQKAMAPVGLLMAVLGYIIGTYVGLGLAWLLGQMAAA